MVDDEPIEQRTDRCGTSGTRRTQSGRIGARGERTRLSAQDLAPRDNPEPWLLDAYGDDETISDKVCTALGRELQADHLRYLNVNTQQGGVVYLRGPVHSEEEDPDRADGAAG